MRLPQPFPAVIGSRLEIGRPLVLGAAIVPALAAGALWHQIAPLSVGVATALVSALVAGRDRFLLVALLAAWGIRAVLTVVLHLLAQFPPAFLTPVLTRPEDGFRFWIFALDSRSYHAAGVKLVSAWRDGTEFPAATGPEYFIFTGLLYFVFGAHPLNVALWNALFGALTVATAYRVAARIAGPAAARVTAVVVALWPSAVIWATQLLKDTICLWLTMAIIQLTLTVIDVTPEMGRRSRWATLRRAAPFAALLVAALVMSRFRHHVFVVFVPATVLLGVALLLARRRRALKPCLATGLVVVLMVTAIFIGRRLDLEAMFAPSHPEAGHINRGVGFQLAGNLDRAEAEYRTALTIRADYPPALRNLAAIAAARGQVPRALDLLGQYVARAPEDEEAGTILATGAVAQLLPKPVPVSRGPIQLTGPGSDEATGRRTVPTDDIVIAIIRARIAYTATGGYSMIDPDIQLTGFGDIVAYLPRAVANLMLVPYPWQWFDIKGGTGPFKGLAALEAIVVYVLLIPLVLGVVLVLRAPTVNAVYVLGFVVLTGLLLALVVTSLGTLFRLRLEFLIPLFTMLGPGLRRLMPNRSGECRPTGPALAA